MAAVNQHQQPKFGTGADTTVKTEGPGLFRTFLNGMALAAGWFTVAGLISYVKNRPAASDESAGFIDEGE
jgi:hypothetical protein